MEPLARADGFRVRADADANWSMKSSRRSTPKSRRRATCACKILPRAEAFAIPDLIRTKINLVPEGIPEIRTLEIVGLDLQADGGTHVANTREVGHMRITRLQEQGRHQQAHLRGNRGRMTFLSSAYERFVAVFRPGAAARAVSRHRGDRAAQPDPECLQRRLGHAGAKSAAAGGDCRRGVIIVGKMDAEERGHWLGLLLPSIGALVLAVTVLPQYRAAAVRRRRSAGWWRGRSSFARAGRWNIRRRSSTCARANTPKRSSRWTA